MEHSSNKAAGMFVVVGVGLLLLILFLVGGKGDLFSASYNLKVKFEEVQGLSQGSVVQLAGVSVGNVEEIIFNQNGELIILLNINKEYQKRITKGSEAGLRTQGALGDKFVYISPGPMDATPLRSGEFLIPEQSMDIFSALSQKGDKFAYIFEILKDTRDLVKDIKGDGELKIAVQNLSNASYNLNKFSKEMTANNSGRELNQSINKLNQILSKVDNGSGTLGAIINDPSLYNKLNQWLGGQEVNPIKSAIRDSIQEREN